MQLAFAAAIGWLVFRHGPDPWVAVGMTLIALAGALTVWVHAREAQAAARADRGADRPAA